MARTPAKREEPGLPAGLTGAVQQDAGKGVSRSAYDNIVPLIYILQPLSPQVNKRNPTYLEGAEPGFIWLRDAPVPLINGDEGLLFQPCYFWRDVVEWIPREKGGGFVARHLLKNDAETMDEAAPRLGGNAVRDPDNPNRVDWVKDNGNDLIETRYHAGYVVQDSQTWPYVIPFSSTGHTVSRRWMFMIGSRMLPDGTPLPSWAGLYRLKTVQKQNSAGTWFQFEPTFHDLVDGLRDAIDGKNPQWQPGRYWKQGKELHEAFARGDKQAENPDTGATTEATPETVI